MCSVSLLTVSHLFVEISSPPTAALNQKKGGLSSTTTIGIFVAYISGITPF